MDTPRGGVVAPKGGAPVAGAAAATVAEGPGGVWLCAASSAACGCRPDADSADASPANRDLLRSLGLPPGVLASGDVPADVAAAAASCPLAASGDWGTALSVLVPEVRRRSHPLGVLAGGVATAAGARLPNAVPSNGLLLGASTPTPLAAAAPRPCSAAARAAAAAVAAAARPPLALSGSGAWPTTAGPPLFESRVARRTAAVSIAVRQKDRGLGELASPGSAVDWFGGRTATTGPSLPPDAVGGSLASQPDPGAKPPAAAIASDHMRVFCAPLCGEGVAVPGPAVIPLAEDPVLDGSRDPSPPAP